VHEIAHCPKPTVGARLRTPGEGGWSEGLGGLLTDSREHLGGGHSDIPHIVGSIVANEWIPTSNGAIMAVGTRGTNEPHPLLSLALLS